MVVREWQTPGIPDYIVLTVRWAPLYFGFSLVRVRRTLNPETMRFVGHKYDMLFALGFGFWRMTTALSYGLTFYLYLPQRDLREGEEYRGINMNMRLFDELAIVPKKPLIHKLIRILT